MRHGETKGVATRQVDPTPHSSEPAAIEQPATSHALVALTPTADMRTSPEAHCQAPFLAQLLAIKDQHPQTRARRRAEPNEAIAAYRATAALTR
jgi:hypothetical protein